MAQGTKDTCLQAQWPEFDPLVPYGRKERNYFFAFSSDMHTIGHEHIYTHNK